MTTTYTFDDSIPEYVREVIERKQQHERVLRISDGTFVYRMLIESDHVSLVARTVIFW